MTTAVHAALSKRFPTTEWAVFFEVRDAAGFNASRSADCVAMNTWPSRGLVVHGVEVKVDRRDWLRELKDPAKSSAIQRFCDYWWLAVDDEKIVKREEIPETWGLLVLRGKSLVAVKEAPKLEAAPLTRNFVAALLRNGTKEMVPRPEVENLVQARIKQIEARESHTRTFENEMAERLKKAYEELQARVRAFEEASGITVTEKWTYGPLRDPTKLGHAVRSFLSGKNHGLHEAVSKAQRQAKTALEALDEALTAVDAVTPEADP